jgi:hypothetical protein
MRAVLGVQHLPHSNVGLCLHLDRLPKGRHSRMIQTKPAWEWSETMRCLESEMSMHSIRKMSSSPQSELGPLVPLLSARMRNCKHCILGAGPANAAGNFGNAMSLLLAIIITEQASTATLPARVR